MRKRGVCLSGVLVLGVTAVLAFVLPAAGRTSSATLTASVGPGFTISLRNDDGTPVTHLDPGTYTINVTDRSDEHNFHLTGTGVDQSTLVEAIGSDSWTVTFQDGRYHFQCDAHVTTMKGDFTVGTVPPTPTVQKLTGKVGPGRAISLKTAQGTRVKALTLGAASISVSDLTKADNFHLSGPGVNRKTGVRSRGRVTWKLVLKAGTYKYRSDAHRKLRGSFRVIVGAP